MGKRSRLGCHFLTYIAGADEALASVGFLGRDRVADRRRVQRVAIAANRLAPLALILVNLQKRLLFIHHLISIHL